MKVKITAIKCYACGDIVYSRANHDFHYCSCGEVAVDAGNKMSTYKDELDAGRVIGGIGRILAKDVSAGNKCFTYLTIDLGNFFSLKEAKRVLYEDWNKEENKYGRIRDDS